MVKLLRRHKKNDLLERSMILASQECSFILPKSQGINLSDIKEIVYYEKPLLTFERLLETYLGAAQEEEDPL